MKPTRRVTIFPKKISIQNSALDFEVNFEMEKPQAMKFAREFIYMFDDDVLEAMYQSLVQYLSLQAD